MNYPVLIQNRKSYREFTDRQVSIDVMKRLEHYYLNEVKSLVPGIRTQLHFFGTDSREALEGAAGYHNFLVGAPQYLVLMSENHELAHINGGFIMEDLVLKLLDLGLDSCWVTFADGGEIKEVLGIESGMDVVAIIAFGYGKKTVKRMGLNIRSMSNVDIRAKHRYMEPKRSIRELTFVDTWGNSRNLESRIGFYDEMLWESLYAASQAPSYLNRQAYGFLLHDGGISLVARPDEYNTKTDGDLSLGAVLLHFTAVAENWTGRLNWRFDAGDRGLEIPKDHKLIAFAAL